MKRCGKCNKRILKVKYIGDFMDLCRKCAKKLMKIEEDVFK